MDRRSAMRSVGAAAFAGGLLLESSAPKAAEAPPAAWEAYARPQRLASLPDGRRMNLVCAGSGSPTVILESGSGWGALSWRKVQAPLARITRTCAYDRAGLGFSDPAPGPRTSAAAVADLAALLKAAAVAPPYVLVGNSLGGMHVRLFADRHLDEVAGLVLVDPAVEHQQRRLEAVAPQMAKDRDAALSRLRGCVATLEREAWLSPAARACAGEPDPGLPASVNAAVLAERARPSYARTSLSEFENLMGASAAELAAARRSYGDLPLVVLTADHPALSPRLPPDQRARAAALWVRMHDELAALSSQGVNRVVPGSGHVIQATTPDAVVAAVAEVVVKARANGRSSRSSP